MALPKHLRAFDDTDTARSWLMEDSLSALQKRFPIEDDEYRLELNNPRLEGKTKYGLQQQKQALLKGTQLRMPIKGTWRLVHKPTGNVLDEREDTVMQMPYLTDRGTFLHGGNEYSTVNQSRLKAGVYTRRKRSGEIEAFYNIKPGTGRAFRVWLEPETGVFKVNMGQANIPLVPLLQAMGVPDKQLVKEWGPEIAAANMQARRAQATEKLFRRLTGKDATADIPDATRKQMIAEAMVKAEVDPDVVAHTLGMQNARNISPEMLLRSSQKLLRVSRNEEDPDDRDAPMFSRVLSAEDFIRERIENDAGKLARTLLWKARRDKGLRRVGPGALNPYVNGYLFGSRLTMPLEETNPLSLLEQSNRITKLGEGGIGDAESITDEARNVNIGQFGFVDPILGPEGCFTPDMDVMTRAGWLRWSDVDLSTEFACMVNGRLEFHKAYEIMHEEYSGSVYECQTRHFAFSVTRYHRLWLRTADRNGKYRPEFPSTITQPRRVLVAGHAPHAGSVMDTFHWPDCDNPGNAFQPLLPVAAMVWAEFIGWYVSEGSTTLRSDGQYLVSLSTHDEQHAARYKQLFEEMGCACNTNRDKSGQVHAVACVRRQLGEYTRQFGKSGDKYLPEEIFDAPIAVRKACLDAMCAGDGRKKGKTFTYCTISRQLAIDVERLAFGLGYSVRRSWEPDARPQSSAGGCWAVHLHIKRERTFKPKHMRKYHYDGPVVCPTVPGGLVYVRKGGYGGHWSGNLNIGIDVRAAHGTYKGRDGQMYAEFKDAKTGELAYMKPEQLVGKTIAFPGELAKGKPTVMAVSGGKIQEVPVKSVDFEVPAFAHMMAANTNLNPMPTGVQPARQFYAAKFWGQYMPQAKGEVPLVDSVMDTGETFSEHYGKRIGSITASKPGTVTRIGKDGIHVTYADGEKDVIELVKDFPFNRLTGISYDTTLKPGMGFDKGDMLAHSNFVDPKTGGLTMGRNLRTAVIPYRGKSVVGETPVFWRKPSGEYTYGAISDMPHGVGMKAMALDGNYRAQMHSVHGYALHAQDSDLVDIETADGMRLGATLSHSFVGFFDDGLRECTIDELTKSGALVPVVQPTLPFGTGACDISCMSVAGKAQSYSFILDRDFGWVVGMYLAEGCCGYRGSAAHHVSFSATEPELIDKLELFFSRHGIHTRTDVRQTADGLTGSVSVYLAAIAQWFAANCGRYAWFKRLPDCLWSAPAEFAEGLIDGYFCGDGTVTDRQCTATTTSRLLADGLTFLLGAFGVRTTYRQYQNGKLAKRPCYQLHVFREFLSQFPVLSLHRKQNALAKLARKPVKFSHDRIPIPTSELSAVRKLARHRLPKDQYVSRGILRRWYDKLPPRTRQLVDAPVWWDYVKSTAPRSPEAYVYDLDMRPLGNFVIGGGWVVHNSYEDAYVISEEAAKKLATRRLYGFDQENSNGIEIGAKKFSALFPDKFKKDQLANIGEDGVVKPGTTVNYGDPLVLATGPKLLTPEDVQLGKLHKALRHAQTDKSVVWEHQYPGIVTDAVMTRHGAHVNVKADVPVQVGDKLSTRFGLKGVVGTIVPMDKMPRDAASNEPFDILQNPMGILSRVAPNQLVELQLGKLARRTGKQQRLPQLPPDEGWTAWAMKQLEEAGIPEKEAVFDPEEERTLPPVATGETYVMPFHHLSEKKLSGRGSTGVGYTMDELPAKGGEETQQAKKMSGMDITQLLAHGATDVIKDAQVIRGARNEDFWKALKLGRPLPEPKIPFVYDKFLNLMKAGGINITQRGNNLDLMPMTDDDIGKLSKGAITSSKMLNDNMEPLAGGLFDPGRTGGALGKSWSHVDLREPMPNPVFEEPIRRLLGLKKAELRDVISGRKELNGKRGGAAIQQALKDIDIDKELARHHELVRKYKGSNRDNSVKILGYLNAAKKQGIHPSNWVMTKVPVLPPIFRPVSKLGDITIEADLNELYRDMIEVNNSIGELRKDVPDDALHEEKETLYDAIGAVMGLGDPITPEGQSRRLKGAIRTVIGDSPKCYDDATELLTTTGWMPFADIREDMFVATVNPVSGALEYQMPGEVVHRAYAGIMVRTLTKKLDLLVTPNHKHWVSARVGGYGTRLSGDEQWAAPTKVEAGTLVGKTKRVHYYSAPMSPRAGAVPVPPVPGIDALAFAEFVGWWLAEGWNQSRQAVLCQAHVNSGHCAAIDAMMARTGFLFERKTYGQSYWWVVSSAELVRWLSEHIGNGAENKRLSPEILAWDHKYLRALLQAYLYGDGERHSVSDMPGTNATFYHRDTLTNYGNRANTASRGLVDDLATLAMHIGLGFRLLDEIPPRNSNQHTVWRFRVDGWNRVVVEKPEQTAWEWYTGGVHCVTVPNGLLVVRRNGRTAISGNSGFFQSRVMAKPVDVVGRGVVTPDPNLDMDSVGIPEDSAWGLYKDFVLRKLVQQNVPVPRALEMIEARNDQARQVLEGEMSRRPVIMDRAPTWHKFNLLAFTPHIVEGDTVRVSPLITKGFTMDFDGDQVNFHVPVSDKAVDQAKSKMRPSKNLFSLTDLKSVRHSPQQEMALGLYMLTRKPSNKPPVRFKDAAAAKLAYKRGEIGPNDPIIIGE